MFNFKDRPLIWVLKDQEQSVMNDKCIKRLEALQTFTQTEQDYITKLVDKLGIGDRKDGTTRCSGGQRV